MSFGNDNRVQEALAIPIAEVVFRLGIAGLNNIGSEMVGPCPVCGGKDRFGVNKSSGVFNCRRCEKGGDQIALVRHVMNCDFKDALSWLVGERDIEIEPAEIERRQKAARAAKAKADAYSEKKRQQSIFAAKAIWDQGKDATGTVVHAYLARRGISHALMPRLPKSLRFHPSLPYTVPADDGAGWKTIHTGPAMLAAIQCRNGRFSAVHRTWLDMAQPKGRLKLPPIDGKDLDTKKNLGSKKAGAIRFGPPPAACDTLVMGEGIETTLTALVADVFPAAAYWSGVDLGNMSGRSQRGTGLKYAGLPDMSDREAFVPPEWVKRLIFIMDGDSEPKMTRAKLECGLRRAMAFRPGLSAQIVHAGEGIDLNDVLMGVDKNE